MYAYSHQSATNEASLIEKLLVIIYGGDSGVSHEDRTTGARCKKQFINAVSEKCEQLKIKAADLYIGVPTEMARAFESLFIDGFRKTIADFPGRLVNVYSGSKLKTVNKDQNVVKRIIASVVVSGLVRCVLRDVYFNPQYGLNRVFKKEDAPLCSIFESPKDYTELTLPCIPTKMSSNLDRVYKLLDEKKQQELTSGIATDREIGFYPIRNLEWNSDKVEELDYYSIIIRRDLKAVRDLTEKELPLLENISEQSLKMGCEAHNLHSS